LSPSRFRFSYIAGSHDDFAAARFAAGFSFENRERPSLIPAPRFFSNGHFYVRLGF